MILYKLIFIIIILYSFFRYVTEKVINFQIKNTKPSFIEKKIKTTLTFKNINKETDLFIIDVKVKPVFCNSTKSIIYDLKLKTSFSDNLTYWNSQVILPGESISLDIELDINNIQDAGNIVSFDIEYLTYGPSQNDKIPRYYQIVASLENIKSIKAEQNNIKWKQINDNGKILSLRTPILTSDDNLIEIINNYVVDHYQDNDILCIAESALAIVQNRFIHHRNLKINYPAKIFSRFPNHVSSLATPGGQQSLINEIGLIKIIYAGIIGGLFKMIGQKGWFYRIAGLQSKLIDDVSGTLAPYDKSIVYGPNNLGELIKKIYHQKNIKIAIVDVNDLEKVDVLACSPNCDIKLINQMLKNNPSGNGAEQTPLTIIRPLIK